MEAGKTAVIRLRLQQKAPFMEKATFGTEFEEVFAARLQEADEFYKAMTPASASKDEANVMRQALAGMLWSKQYFDYDVDKWLKEHNADPFDPKSRGCRNKEWFHLVSDDIDLHAGQVGISLVRGLGPCLSLPRPYARGSGFCQGAA